MTRNRSVPSPSGARGRPGIPGAAALVLVAIAGAVGAGCGPSSDGDPKLTIYLSAPLSGPRASDGRDVADGAELALADAGGEAAGIPVSLEVLDDADENGWDAALSGANARRASQDSTAIAYLGEVDSGASRTSIPITNEASILQVSPAAGAEDLTSEAFGSTTIPAAIQPSGARTFGRVIPSDRAQGQAAGAWMSREGVTSVAVIGGDEPFGGTLSSGIAAASTAPAIVEENESPEALYLAGERFDAGGPASAPGGALPLFGSDALLEGDAPPEGIKLTSAALDPSQLPPGAATFLADFEAEHGPRPGRLAAYGYEAMAVALDSIERADDPLDRRAVVAAFFATTDRSSILGTYSIDPIGNTTLESLGAYEVRGGRVAAEARPLSAG